MSNNATHKNRKNRKRAVAIGLIGLGVVGLGAASAATLAITATGYDDVAAGSKAVVLHAACATSVAAKFAPARDYTAPVNGVDGASGVTVTLSALATGCDGKNVKIAVYDGSGTTAVGTYTGTLDLSEASGTATAPLTLAGVTTDDTFDSVSIVIG